jgi:hypothetical protein
MPAGMKVAADVAATDWSILRLVMFLGAGVLISVVDIDKPPAVARTGMFGIGVNGWLGKLAGL